MYADLDYYSCQYACKWLENRRKASLVTINIPEPAEKQIVLDFYAQAFHDSVPQTCYQCEERKSPDLQVGDSSERKFALPPLAAVQVGCTSGR